MKFKRAHAAIIFLLMAFIVFFINVLVVISEKNSTIERLTKEKESLRKMHESLQRDHSDLRKEKVILMKRLSESKPDKDNEEAKSPDNK